MVIAKILVGLLALFIAWSYLFHNKLVFRLNAWMREYVFNDNVVLFSGRRVAILLVILGAVALFSGLENLVLIQPVRPHIAAQIVEQARLDLAQKRYPQVIRRCRELTKTNPDYIPAWELMVSAWSEMGEKELARRGASVILRLDPDHPIGKGVFRGELEKIQREKSE